MRAVRRIVVRFVAPAALLLVLADGCGSKGGKGDKGEGGPRGKGSGEARGGRGGGQGLKFPVDVYSVEAHRMVSSVTAPGTIEAFERVQVTARVSGAVDKVAFVDGQEVKKGDVLVVIDSARFQTAVNSAKAAVEKASASQKDAEAMIKRRETATEKYPGLIPGEELSTFKTKELTARADTAVALEGLRSAELNLRDAWVRAPMDGIIQTRTVETGQYVQPGYVMATLLRHEPLLLRFRISPLEAPRVKVGMIADLKLRETTRIFHAKITLVAAAADPESRMVNVTAEVIDEGHDYWLRPGSFCDVTLPVEGRREVVIVPRAAVRPTERGFVAYVIEDEKAHERVLTLGMNTRDGWVEVREGLKPSDKLVLRGAEPLSDGSGVTVTEVPAPQSEAFREGSSAASGSPSAGPAPSASAGPSASPTTTPRPATSGGRPR